MNSPNSVVYLVVAGTTSISKVDQYTNNESHIVAALDTDEQAQEHVHMLVEKSKSNVGALKHHGDKTPVEIAEIGDNHSKMLVVDTPDEFFMRWFNILVRQDPPMRRCESC